MNVFAVRCPKCNRSSVPVHGQCLDCLSPRLRAALESERPELFPKPAPEPAPFKLTASGAIECRRARCTKSRGELPVVRSPSEKWQLHPDDLQVEMRRLGVSGAFESGHWGPVSQKAFTLTCRLLFVDPWWKFAAWTSGPRPLFRTVALKVEVFAATADAINRAATGSLAGAR